MDGIRCTQNTGSVCATWHQSGGRSCSRRGCQFQHTPNLIDVVTCFDASGNYTVFLREKALWWSFACKYVDSAARCMICNNECQDLSLLHADSGPCLSLLASWRHPLHRWDPSHAKSRWNSTMFDSGMPRSSEVGSSQCISFWTDWKDHETKYSGSVYCHLSRPPTVPHAGMLRWYSYRVRYCLQWLHMTLRYV